ncbi:Interleukin-22 receptor subunit alpha-2 [Nibea albiflora]|uniref:Interleukin-22 receptor subunit alpha-2 n=1 Tax=Nibea albiflora TaxID=240163 RepID=A0ACB7EEF0_NIBAL|nr:Interleukin-22 receptor subunit alpha-2 [Nibea albiflora]
MHHGKGKLTVCKRWRCCRSVQCALFFFVLASLSSTCSIKHHGPPAARSRAAGEPERHGASYGEPQWLDVKGCQGIQRQHCDLSSVTSETREWYYARVHASSPPASNPPVLRLNVTEEGIVVRVKPPKPNVRKMHSSLQYKIYLIHTSGEEEVYTLDCCSTNKLLLKELNQRAVYCLQAQTVILLQAKTSARGSLKCVSTL